MTAETHAELITAAIEALIVDHATIAAQGAEGMDDELRMHRQQLRYALASALEEFVDSRVLRKLG